MGWGAPIDVLERWDVDILNLEIRAQERIFAWSSQSAASSGLRWEGVINTSPPKLDLTSDGLIGFPPPRQNKKGSPNVFPGGSKFSYSVESRLVKRWILIILKRIRRFGQRSLRMETLRG